MSLKRTPPRASPSMQSLAHCKSDSNINESPSAYYSPTVSSEYNLSEPNIARKRKYSGDLSKLEILNMFAALQKQQDEKFEALMTKVQGGIDSHTEQNKSISSSIEFLGQKYDEMAIRINALEQDKSSAHRYIQTLEAKLEHMDRYLRSSSIEIRNVPKNAGETKEDLLKIVKKVGNALSLPIQSSEIRDVYRINTKNENNQAIVAELTTVSLRDGIVGSVKAYNKKYPTSKFSTSNLKIEGPTRPIFVSESLTIQAKKLFFLAREYAKNNDFKYCWSSHGRIYLRRKDGAPLIKINNEEDIDNLKK